MKEIFTRQIEFYKTNLDKRNKENTVALAFFPKLKFIHLQLTLKCNLQCSFCGQWGENGFMRGKTTPELSLLEWLKIIEEIGLESAKRQIVPEFIIWGGEPLVSPYFSDIAGALKNNGFKVSLVTNGILLEQFYEVINDTINTIFISLDGPEKVHEKIRDKKGIYKRIISGIKKLDSAKVEIINLLTICEDNITELVEFPVELGRIGFSRTIYQNLIYCDSFQAGAYKKWLKKDFSQDAEKLKSWITNGFGDWINKLPAVIKEIENREYPIKVELFPYELNSGNILDWFNPQVKLKDESIKCLMPYRHLHINPDGNAHFCVDFNDFVLGNAAREGVYKLFYSRKAEKFRKDSNPLCKRCPWFYNKEIK
jgi:MoaA/NifB/PqqE/SkfB family radical SAM enzyme